MLVGFGSYELDKDRRELRFREVPVHVEPQVLDLLIYLVANRNHVVSKDDMVKAVWGGRIVSDVTLNSRINAARRAVGDNGKTQALIRTVPRRGFRFVGESTITRHNSNFRCLSRAGLRRLNADSSRFSLAS
jgi:DNA-binding winged helix-turn-helix (wHTH) protein